jgi:hypothetical protein
MSSTFTADPFGRGNFTGREPYLKDRRNLAAVGWGPKLKGGAPPNSLQRGGSQAPGD